MVFGGPFVGSIKANTRENEAVQYKGILVDAAVLQFSENKLLVAVITRYNIKSV